LSQRTLSRRVGEGLERLRAALKRAGYDAAPAVVVGSLAHTAPPVPASLSAAVAELMAGGAEAKATGVAARDAHGGQAGVASKGGFIVKIGLGIAAAGLVAGGVFWAVDGKSEEGAKPAPVTAPPGGQPAKSSEKRIVPLCGVPGGPLMTQDGPGLSAAFPWHTMSLMDKFGNLYIMDPAQQQIFLYWREEKRVYTLCSGKMGYRDGPAGQAQVGLILTDVNNFMRFFDDQERLCFHDPMSGTLRRIAPREDGKWEITTIMGAGPRAVEDLKPGETVPASEVGKLPSGGSSCAARTPGGSIVLGFQGLFLKLSGDKVTRLPCKSWIGTVANMAADDDGNIYVLEIGFYLKVDKDGNCSFLGGTRNNQAKGYMPKDIPPQSGWDGPMITAGFWCPSLCSLSAAVS
ncbi:MAG: hypothetical protein N2439_03565, partial [Anaerolineae bacterium]|nr:hypothetical protein [Anaerolineae bacterium]